MSIAPSERPTSKTLRTGFGNGHKRTNAEQPKQNCTSKQDLECDPKILVLFLWHKTYTFLQRKSTKTEKQINKDMQEFTYNGMPEGAFIVDKAETAIALFREQCQCDVKHCVFPTNGWAEYYISESGRCFGIRQYKLNRKFVCYEMSLATDIWRPNMMPNYLLRPDFGHQVKVRADKMVYCTFVFGEWRSDIDIAYKDGNRNNCHLDNLYLVGDNLMPYVRDKMEKYQDMYNANFMFVARYIAYVCKCIGLDEAKDAAQDSFIWLTTKDYEFNLFHWMKYGKLYGLQHIRKENVDNIDFVPIGRMDNNYEIDVTQFITNPKAKQYFDLYLQGYEQHEIFRMLDLDPSLLSYHIRKSRKIIKEELSKDIKWLMLG